MLFCLFSFCQLGELRCLQAKQNKLRHWNSFLKCVWWLMLWHIPQHMHCAPLGCPGHSWDTANGTHGTKGKVISREWLLLQLESRQIIFWVSVHCLSVSKPAPNLPRPHSGCSFLFFPPLFAGTVAYFDSLHFFRLKQPQGRLLLPGIWPMHVTSCHQKQSRLFLLWLLLKLVQPGWEQDTPLSHDILWEEFSLKEVFLKNGSQGETCRFCS